MKLTHCVHTHTLTSLNTDMSCLLWKQKCFFELKYKSLFLVCVCVFFNLIIFVSMVWVMVYGKFYGMAMRSFFILFLILRLRLSFSFSSIDRSYFNKEKISNSFL